MVNPRKLRNHPGRWLIVVDLLMVLALLIAPQFAPYDPVTTNPGNQLAAPSVMHPLGTDVLGRDVLSRTLHGGRNTLLLALLATGIAFAAGLPLGLLAGFSPRWLDRAIAVAVDVLLAVPGLLLALVLLTLFGRGAVALALALGLAQVALVARVVRAAVQIVRVQPYVASSYAQGAGHGHVMRWHILRGAQPTLLAYAAVTFSYMLLNAAALGLLGLGLSPGTPEWGLMLAEGRESFRVAPWVVLAPGSALTLTIIWVNVLAARLNRQP